MSNLIPFPPRASRPASRVDLLCRAIAEDKGPRPLITFESHADGVCVRIGDLEIWIDAKGAFELSEDLLEASLDAEAKAEGRCR